MSRVGRQATRPSWISNAPAGQAAKPSPMPAPVVGSPASVSRFPDPLLPPPPPPPPITVAAGITVTPSRSTGSPKTWPALSASRSDLNASCGSTGSVVRARWSRSCLATGGRWICRCRPERLVAADRDRDQPDSRIVRRRADPFPSAPRWQGVPKGRYCGGREDDHSQRGRRSRPLRFLDLFRFGRRAALPKPLSASGRAGEETKEEQEDIEDVEKYPGCQRDCLVGASPAEAVEVNDGVEPEDRQAS